MPELTYVQRPARGEADGLLILHHGGGADESDVLGLASVLDRAHRMHVVAPRAPLKLDGADGYDWYTGAEVGYPDADTFLAGYAELCELHDTTWRETGIPAARTVLAGFAAGSVMSYATGLGPGRPRPAGILVFSGFIPTVDGWEPELHTRDSLPVLIAHGRTDQEIGIEFARRASATLTDAGLDVTMYETGGSHTIDPTAKGKAIQWLGRVV